MAVLIGGLHSAQCQTKASVRLYLHVNDAIFKYRYLVLFSRDFTANHPINLTRDKVLHSLNYLDFKKDSREVMIVCRSQGNEVNLTGT